MVALLMPGDKLGNSNKTATRQLLMHHPDKQAVVCCTVEHILCLSIRFVKYDVKLY